MKVEHLDLMHKVSLLVGPKVDQGLVKKILTLITLISSRKTGEDLIKVIKNMD